MNNLEFDAVILAAGKGKRMKPFSDIIPKPMLPLLNRPVISLIIERLLNVGAKKIVIVVSKDNHKEIREYFSLKEPSITIEYCVQDPPSGTADAIYKGGIMCSSSIIFSVAGDNLFSENFFRKMVETFSSNKENPYMVLALQEVTNEEIKSLSSVAIDTEGKITSIIEKPSEDQILSNYASLSMYLFNAKALQSFKNVKKSSRGEYEAPDAIKSLIEDKKSLIGCVVEDDYIHISNPNDLWQHNMNLLGNKNIISPTSSVDQSTLVRSTIIDENVVIGEQSNLKACLILKNVNIPPHTTIENAIVGSSEKGINIFQIK